MKRERWKKRERSKGGEREEKKKGRKKESEEEIGEKWVWFEIIKHVNGQICMLRWDVNGCD